MKLNNTVMKGFIEIKEDSYEDTIEHLYRIKMITCKLIKMLSEHSEIYEDIEDLEDTKYSHKDSPSRRSKGRYDY